MAILMSWICSFCPSPVGFQPPRVPPATPCGATTPTEPGPASIPAASGFWNGCPPMPPCIPGAPPIIPGIMVRLVALLGFAAAD